MATAQVPLTPTTDTTPVVVNIPSAELSGAQWVARFAGSNRVADCVSPFRENLTSFVAALSAAGASTTVNATLRPAQRAYLMHWAWKIANSKATAASAGSLQGVNIKWDHPTDEASVSAAQDMVNGYGLNGLKVAPALASKHISGLAVDMNISWSGTLTIANSDATSTTIATEPKNGMNVDLHAVGATYGVIKFVGGATDKPHWSDDGH
jgi:hypothetical protein